MKKALVVFVVSLLLFLAHFVPSIEAVLTQELVDLALWALLVIAVPSFAAWQGFVLVKEHILIWSTTMLLPVVVAVVAMCIAGYSGVSIVPTIFLGIAVFALLYMLGQYQYYNGWQPRPFGWEDEKELSFHLLHSLFFYDRAIHEYCCERTEILTKHLSSVFDNPVSQRQVLCCVNDVDQMKRLDEHGDMAFSILQFMYEKKILTDMFRTFVYLQEQDYLSGIRVSPREIYRLYKLIKGEVVILAAW